MKKFMSLFLLLMTVNVAYGLELACQGEQRNSQVKTYFVDCSNLDALVDVFKEADELVKREKGFSNGCNAAYYSAKGNQRSFNRSNISSIERREIEILAKRQTSELFSLCNRELQDIK